MAGRHYIDAPYARGVTVTPSDATVLPVTAGLYVGTAGALVVKMCDGNNVTFPACPAGFHPIQVTMVLSTGTAASNIVALYY